MPMSGFPQGAITTSRVHVAVFLACDCPISQKYVPVLNEIYEKYRTYPALEWSFIVPGRVSKREVKSFIDEYDVRFPLRRDRSSGKEVTSSNAEVTPQVVMRSDHILYSGAIDNWFYELGQYRQVITEHYMTDALDQILAGGSPAIQQTKAVGCPIAKR